MIDHVPAKSVFFSLSEAEGVVIEWLSAKTLHGSVSCIFFAVPLWDHKKIFFLNDDVSEIHVFWGGVGMENLCFSSGVVVLFTI